MSTASSVATLLAHNMKRVDIAHELGLTPSAITQVAAQLPAREATPDELALDASYDSLESKLLKQLDRTAPLLLRPMEIAKVLSVVNAAKRRGGPLKDKAVAPTILQLNLPVAIQNRFVLNSANQVVSAGQQDLVTIPSAAVAKLAAATHPTGNHHNHVLNLSSSEGEEDEFGFSYSSSASSR